ncbi:GMC oxidoreductase-domain-containing protein [Crepidotus variabilis]|uniref:pyranose dehydrogenase (acceptor) n=1 Tax=Crepidotus variabilis TaxID=179855 RepID=A0A9P6ENY1_9AGAR|nr:GMC oxidoreductase-domain-containing protein [Crepidotus variabilis]
MGNHNRRRLLVVEDLLKVFSYRPRLQQIFPQIRGRNGPVIIGFNNFVSGWWNLFIQAGIAAGIPLSKDFNSADGNIIGIGRWVFLKFAPSDFWLQNLSDLHLRQVSASLFGTAYLTPDVLKRPNVTVAINSTASRVLFNTTGQTPVVVGVEFAARPEGPFYHVKADKEVVVCAGTVQSPAVLMLSGVVPAAHLKEKGIAVVKDIPGVGSNLLDHPIVQTYFKHNNTVMRAAHLFPNIIFHVFQLIGSLIQHLILGTGGALASNLAAAFVRTDDPVLFAPSEYPEKLLDSTSAKDAPDLELFITPFAFSDHGRAFFDIPALSLHCYLVRPTSKGTITLKSSDPFDHPKIDPKYVCHLISLSSFHPFSRFNYLQTKEDLDKLVRGFRLACKIAHAEPLNSLFEHTFDRSDFDHFAHLKTDAEIQKIIRDRVETVYHPNVDLSDGSVKRWRRC